MVRSEVQFSGPADRGVAARRRDGDRGERRTGADRPVCRRIAVVDCHQISAFAVFRMPGPFQLIAGEPPTDWTDFQDPETGLVPLGDMCISLERAIAQAKEFGHSTRREVGYLTIHSMLHLLGYDHLDEGPQKKQMRGREEAILAELGITRED